MGSIRNIYDHFGFQMTPETEVQIKRYVEANPKNKHGTHSYNMSDYGITNEDLRDSFGPFLEYFKDKSPDLIPDLYENTKL